jgi:hypothetical protein
MWYAGCSMVSGAPIPDEFRDRRNAIEQIVVGWLNSARIFDAR